MNEVKTSKHTPGPLNYFEASDSPNVGDHHWYSVMTQQGTIVALRTVGEANARLQASAPDLLAALERFYQWERSLLDDAPKAIEMGLPPIEFPESSIFMDGWLQEHIYGPVEAAITKARGQS